MRGEWREEAAVRPEKSVLCERDNLGSMDISCVGELSPVLRSGPANLPKYHPLLRRRPVRRNDGRCCRRLSVGPLLCEGGGGVAGVTDEIGRIRRWEGGVRVRSVGLVVWVGVGVKGAGGGVTGHVGLESG